MSAIRTNKADARSGRFIAPYTRWVSRTAGGLLVQELTLTEPLVFANFGRTVV